MTIRPRFAALGHQECWSQLSAIVRELRPATMSTLDVDELREIVQWIPPRTVSRFKVAAECGSPPLSGVYIDTFITPEELEGRPSRRVLGKVWDAIAAAEREGVSVVTLGGFTSILLESSKIPVGRNVALTTGNSLTTALIVRGLERALELLGRKLESEDLLIIGATGDVGSACARSLLGRPRTMLLSARNARRLEREAQALTGSGRVEWSIDVRALLERASVVIAAASTSMAAFDANTCRSDAIICDAGYPKNIAASSNGGAPRIFWGGMGVIGGGLRSDDGILEQFYHFPVADVAHGCMLEGAVLALAGRFECFSEGRGRISREQVEEMWGLAVAHGVRLAPLFDALGVWPEERAFK